MQVNLQIPFYNGFTNYPKIQSQRKFDGFRNFATGVDTVSFSGKGIDLLDKPKREIFKILSSAINNSENNIGMGGEATVYAIPNTNYCVRCLHPNDFKISIANIKAFSQSFNKNISEKDKVNHVLANLRNGASVMLKIKGKPIAGYKMTSDDIAKMAEEISVFPPEVYNKFLKQITTAYDKGMMFDPHPSNVIVDTKKKTFTPIDFVDEEIFFKEFSPLYDMFYTFINSSTNPVQQSRIVKNIFKAGLSELKPEVKPCVPIDKLDFSELIETVINHPYSQLGFVFPDIVSLDNNITRLNYLKMQELSGKNVNKELASLHKILTKKVDEIFYL